MSGPQMIFKHAIPRRTVLRGLGATIALPLLDAMVPALSALAQTPGNPIRRFGVVYQGMGAAQSAALGVDYFTPQGEGRGWVTSPILKPLEPFRDHMLVLTNLSHPPALARLGEPAGPHGPKSGSFMTGVHVKPTEGPDFEAAISVDQLAAKALGQETQFGSLELQTESVEFAGGCDAGFSCAYQNTLCWSGPKTPLPMENNPRAVFERLFGDGSTDSAARLSRMRGDLSILDAVTRRAAHLQSRLGTGDRAKITEYLDAVRDVERRIQKAEAQSDRELPPVTLPPGIPDKVSEHIKLMFDIQVLAYQTDLTRVITFMMLREASNRTYPEIGLSEGHHVTSHHQDDPEELAKLTKMNVFNTTMLAYYLEKLRSTPDGDGSLLDHMVLLYGSAMGNSNLHDPHHLPLVLIGGDAGRIKGGRHIVYPEGTRLANLWVSMLDKVGVPVESFGDSTGTLDHLSDV